MHGGRADVEGLRLRDNHVLVGWHRGQILRAHERRERIDDALRERDHAAQWRMRVAAAIAKYFDGIALRIDFRCGRAERGLTRFQLPFSYTHHLIKRRINQLLGQEAPREGHRADGEIAICLGEDFLLEVCGICVNEWARGVGGPEERIAQRRRAGVGKGEAQVAAEYAGGAAEHRDSALRKELRRVRNVRFRRCEQLGQIA